MKRMRHLIIFCMGLFLIGTLTMNTTVTYAKETTQDLAENAKAAILIDRDTGKIIYEKNMDEQLPPASMTKIMTLLLVMEAIDTGELSYDEKIVISENASSMGGSQVFLEAGEEMTVNDLIKAVAIASGNDASVALAERLAGSEKAFAEKMNDKAKELGLKNTSFHNASGLPEDDHHSTAHDMAMIAKELLKYEQITKYTSIYEDYLREGNENEFWLVNTNKLVHFYPYVDGLKTGYTSEAKFSLTATAKKNDMRLISVVMGADSTKKRNRMTMEMIDYGFSHYEVEKLYERNEQVGELKMLQSEKYCYPVKTSEQISTLHEAGDKAKEVEPEITIKQPDKLPLEKGETVGEITIRDGKETRTSPLVLDEELKPASYYQLWKRSLSHIAKKVE
ncbi:MAG TPA: D-alanyl-D-alanine carboxypeptidase family protein [Pseudogracilibacillus sp.]|nr:D-alanyl-D-alanine carboxypeptidase family protein [Pseudogracilibacillus sp.]